MKKGISLVTLAITILIFFILLSTAAISIDYSVNNAKKKAFATEIYNIQMAVSEFIDKEGRMPDVLKSISANVTGIQQFEDEAANNILLNELDLKSLGIDNTTYGNKENSDEKDIYVISSTTFKVYYLKGAKIGKDKYYTLTDELLKSINRNQNLTVDKNVVIFKPSIQGYTNEAVQVTVKVPTTFSNVNLTISDSEVTYTTTTTSEYTQYVINSNKKIANYNINIGYTYNGQNKTAVYNVDKIDITAPLIEKDSYTPNTANQIKGLRVSDYPNENKMIKLQYVEGKISKETAIEYFKDHGKEIKNGSFRYKKLMVYTIMATDRAGNVTITYIDSNGKLNNNPLENIIFDGAVIPRGFAVSDIIGENTVKDGLVIYEGAEKVSTDVDAKTTRNQFVWIPIKDINNFIRRDGYVYDVLQTQVSSGIATEPFSKGTLNQSNDLTGEYAEHAAMKASVEKYGGFYIARYEAGKEGSDTVVSKKGAALWTSIPWGDSMTSVGTTGAVYRSRQMYKNTNIIKDAVVSHLVYAVEWDNTVRFISDKYNIKNANTDGNYINYNTSVSADKQVVGAGVKQAAGYSEYWKTKNIYDLNGNVREWSMEAYNYGERVRFSGYYGDEGRGAPASNRYSSSPTVTSEAIGFRVALYLM